MSGYAFREVQRMLNLSRGTIRGLIEKGFVTPERGPRSAYRFSFKDLVVLRAARALHAARVPARRISRSLAELRRQLPATAPLSGLHISAIGSDVVVREGGGHRLAESGQYLLALDVQVSGGTLRFVERREPSPEDSADAWFDRGLSLEEEDRQAAVAAYRQATLLDARYAEAYVNWGRLLHDMGALSGAERVYRAGLKKCRKHPLLSYNLGVLLESLGQPQDAVSAYLDALTEDRNFPDCHYNLARLYDELGEAQAAIRHFSEYRRLTAR